MRFCDAVLRIHHARYGVLDAEGHAFVMTAKAINIAETAVSQGSSDPDAVEVIAPDNRQVILWVNPQTAGSPTK